MKAIKKLAERWDKEAHAYELEAIQASEHDEALETALKKRAAETRQRACELEVAMLQDELDSLTVVGMK